MVMLDSNANAKYEVRTARFALARELSHMGARVRVATVPPLDGVNGPDDLIAVGVTKPFALRSNLLSQPRKRLLLNSRPQSGRFKRRSPTSVRNT